MTQLFTSSDQSIGVSASTSALPVNTQDSSPLEWTGWISLQSKGLSSLLQHRSSKASILQRSAFFTVQLSHPYMTTGKTIALTRWTFIGNMAVFQRLSIVASPWDPLMVVILSRRYSHNFYIVSFKETFCSGPVFFSLLENWKHASHLVLKMQVKTVPPQCLTNKGPSSQGYGFSTSHVWM